MRISAPGVQRRTGIRVIYTVGTTTYQADFDAAIVNLPPAAAADGRATRTRLPAGF